MLLNFLKNITQDPFAGQNQGSAQLNPAFMQQKQDFMNLIRSRAGDAPVTAFRNNLNDYLKQNYGMSIPENMSAEEFLQKWSVTPHLNGFGQTQASLDTQKYANMGGGGNPSPSIYHKLLSLLGGVGSVMGGM